MSTARVDFTRSAAERIANVVRTVEAGDRDGEALRFGRAMETMPAGLRLATFTGDWEINTYKTVTFYGVTSTPNTASVLNLCTPSVGFSTANTSETRYVIFGKVKHTTDPVVVELQAAPTNTACVSTLGGVDLTHLPGWSASTKQTLSQEDGCLKWTNAETSYSGSCRKPQIYDYDLTTLAGYSASKKQALVHDNGCLKWMDIEECP